MAKDYLYMLELIEKWKRLYGRPPTKKEILLMYHSK
jgi:hypothetical protein